MKRKWTWILTGVALVALAVVASAAARADQATAPAVAQEQEAQAREKAQQKLAAKLAEAQARLVRKMVELQANAEVREKLAAEMAYQHALAMADAQARAEEMAHQHAMHAQAEKLSQLQRLGDDPAILLEDGESGWLGVSITEVTAEKVKELKLPAERGVVVTEVESDSAAAKAGFKTGDVIIEFAGQRIEGTVQFRRLVRETLVGRTVAVTVWREGRAQNLSVVLGSRRDFIRDRITVYTPKDFSFALPKMDLFSMRTPTLGISGEDLSGQLGQYFGAPDGEGVLIKHVNSGSPAEKAGMKAGDVITKMDGERIRTIEDLRSKMRDKREQKSVNVTVLRKGAETSLKVEIEPPATKRDVRRTISRRISM